MPVFGMDSSNVGKAEDTFDKILALFTAQNRFARVNLSQPRILSGVKKEQLLQKIYSNFVLVPKLQISGVSGFLCPKCLKPDAVYIKDLAFDRTMKNKHHCSPSDLESLKIPDFKSILPAAELEENEMLFAMTKSWLPGPAFLNTLEMPCSPNTSPELYVIDLAEVPSNEWLYQYINKKAKYLDDNNLQKFLAIAKATYAIFVLPDKRRFFMFISPWSQ